jgi:hypothetical protein
MPRGRSCHLTSAILTFFLSADGQTLTGRGKKSGGGNLVLGHEGIIIRLTEGSGPTFSRQRRPLVEEKAGQTPRNYVFR